MKNIYRAFLASDGAGGGSDGSGDGEKGRKDGDGELAKVISQRDKYKTDLEAKDAEIAKTKADLEALNAKLSDTVKNKAVTEKDIETLKSSFQKDVDTERSKLEKERAQREDALKKLNEVIIERDVMAEVRAICKDPSVAFMILRDEIEIVEVDGKVKAKPKNSDKSIKDYFETRLEEMDKGYLLNNDRKKGTDGAGSKSSGGKGAEGMTKEKLAAMGEVARKKYFADHPEAMKLLR